jgi:flagellin
VATAESDTETTGASSLTAQAPVALTTSDYGDSDVTGTFGGMSSVTYSISVSSGTGGYTYNVTGSDGYSASTTSTSALTQLAINDAVGGASLTFSNASVLAYNGNAATFTMNPASATYQLAAGSGTSVQSVTGGITVTVTGSSEMQGTLTVGNTSAGQTANGEVVSFSMGNTTVSSLTTLGASVSTGTAQFKVANDGQAATLVPGSMSLATPDYATANSGINISTQASAQVALTTLSTALQTVDTQRASIGATMNSLSFAQNNSQSEATNLVAARAGYWDANMPAETSKFMQQQTLEQADVGLLAQAQQLPANLLKLIP